MKITGGLAEGQVLQRSKNSLASATIIGLCAAEGSVEEEITLLGKGTFKRRRQNVGQAAKGKFEARLRDIPAGGPYRLRLTCNGESVTVAEFFVGDVWVLAGQSNMVGSGFLSGKARPHSKVRSFSMRREWRLADEPLHVYAESPDVCHHSSAQCTPADGERLRKNAVKGTSLGVFFGRKMVKLSGVPQGLVCTAHGGTRMDQWDPAIRNRKGASLYWSMLTSIRATGQPVAGVLWYQGESDGYRDLVNKYTPRMKKLVGAMRRDLKLPHLPWIIAQISKVYGDRRDPVLWNRIQEQQRKLSDHIAHLETVATIDLPHDDPAHLGADGYPLLGRRMALAADHLVYGNKNQKSPPRLSSVRLFRTPKTTFDNRIEIAFEGVEKKLISQGPPRGFSLTTPDNLPGNSIYRAQLEKNCVILHLGGKLLEGTRLHYGRGTAPECNICDERGFSLPVFGPWELSKPKAYLPFVNTWEVSDLFEPSIPLRDLGLRPFEQIPFRRKTYDQGFANEHNSWKERPGLALFRATIQMDEPMNLEFLMGYDGPFRLWVDGKPFFNDLNGINPCLPDKNRKSALLRKGSHSLNIAMDTNGGRAWGFYLRFCRKDVSHEEARTNSFARPSYGT